MFVRSSVVRQSVRWLTVRFKESESRVFESSDGSSTCTAVSVLRMVLGQGLRGANDDEKAVIREIVNAKMQEMVRD